jgi:hypothetical protein
VLYAIELNVVEEEELIYNPWKFQIIHGNFVGIDNVIDLR